MIKRILFAFILSLLMVQVVAQTGSITNVLVSQRSDGSGMVDVYFKLTGTGTGYLINIEASFNGGSTYSPIAATYLSGDVGPINPGSNKHIVWNGLGSFPNTYTSQAMLKIIASSGSAPVAAFTGSPTSGIAPLTVSFTDQSTNSPTTWLWDFGDGTTSTQLSPSKTYNNAGSYTVKLTATNSYGSNTLTKLNYISVTSGGGGTAVVEVLNPATGKTWMDRNLGASRAAISSADDQAYGDLYQWGRGADGHEKRTSGTTSTLSSSDTPGHGNFILAPNSPYDWRSPQNTNLWQGVNGTNNPCPSAYRLPTEAELNAECASWSSNNAAGAFNSPLKLPVAGHRSYGYGSLYSVGSFGYYWSATVDGTYARRLYLYSSFAYGVSSYRAYGFSVRCLKD